MKTVLIQTHQELPGVAVPLCPVCSGLQQAENSRCTARHGGAHVKDVLRMLCPLVGHDFILMGRPVAFCARCRVPRSRLMS